MIYYLIQFLDYFFKFNVDLRRQQWRLDSDLIFTKIKSAWAVIGIYHDTKLDIDILKIIDGNLPTNGSNNILPPFEGRISIFLWKNVK